MKLPGRNWQIFIQCRKNEDSRKELFDQIWNQYQGRIVYFIRNMIRDNAEDLFQDIMLKVYQNLERYNPVYSFDTWIYTIARNHCLNHLNRKKISIVNPDSENTETLEGMDNDSPEKIFFDTELRQNIETLLRRLDRDNRQIAFLYYYEGMKNRNIAHIMKIPTGTVKSRLHKIRALLKKDLEKFYG